MLNNTNYPLTNPVPIPFFDCISCSVEKKYIGCVVLVNRSRTFKEQRGDYKDVFISEIDN